MILKTLAETEMGEQILIQGLVDTGAEVNLVRRGLFAFESEVQAEKPVRLHAVIGETLAGGAKCMTPQLQFSVTEDGAGVPQMQHLKDVFYVADIKCDIILGYPFLNNNKLGVVPHYSSLLLNHKGKWKWLQGIPSSARRRKNDEDNEKPITRPTSPRGRSWRSFDYALKRQWVDYVVDASGGEQPEVDAFASPHNKIFEDFWCEENDAFSKNWGGGKLLWMNPPYNIMAAVLDTISKEKARCILIVPVWKGRAWRETDVILSL